MDDSEGEQVFALVATVETDNCDAPQRCADACLIAAAPELLSALQSILRIVNDARANDEVDASTEAGGYLCGDVMSEAVEAAKAIIAKAINPI